jgi:hypothetical protein
VCDQVIEYTPDSTVKSVQVIEASGGGFGWQELSCTTTNGVVTCKLPGSPGESLIASASLTRADGQPGWSCVAYNKCDYVIRGTMKLVKGDCSKVELKPSNNGSGCYGCNAGLSSDKKCDPAKPNCTP